jgi:hypothetical protein
VSEVIKQLMALQWRPQKTTFNRISWCSIAGASNWRETAQIFPNTTAVPEDLRKEKANVFEYSILSAPAIGLQSVSNSSFWHTLKQWQVAGYYYRNDSLTKLTGQCSVRLPRGDSPENNGNIIHALMLSFTSCVEGLWFVLHQGHWTRYAGLV